MYQTIQTIAAVLLVVMTIAIMCWAIIEIIRTNRDYKASMKALDEWYEREKAWLESVRKEDVEPKTTESGFNEADKTKSDSISRQALIDALNEKKIPYQADIDETIRELPSVDKQEFCDRCEIRNPCLYCKHDFEEEETK